MGGVCVHCIFIATEPDAAKRKAQYGDLNDPILEEQFVIPIASSAEFAITRTQLQGLKWDFHSARKYADVWLA